MVSTVFIKIISLIVGFLIGLIAFIIYFHKIKILNDIKIEQLNFKLNEKFNIRESNLAKDFNEIKKLSEIKYKQLTLQISLLKDLNSDLNVKLAEYEIVSKLNTRIEEKLNKKLIEKESEIKTLKIENLKHKKLKYKIIKSEKQYNKYCNILDEMVFNDNKTKDINDEISLLTLLIENWDREHSC